MDEVRWDAKEAAGKVVPSGISICALRAGGVPATGAVVSCVLSEKSRFSEQIEERDVRLSESW
jgi:hypothetical protein